MSANAPGTAARTLEWVQNNIGAGARKVRRWDAKAGFAPGTAWCGIFLGNAMRAQGLPVPSGYAAAVNWSGYGAAVKSLREARPGDILVYGSTHVAMYLGNGRQIQGNNSNGTVGVSAAGSSIGLGPVTAIRRPPYKGRSRAMTPAEKRKFEVLAEHENLGSGFGDVVPGGHTIEKAAGDAAGAAAGLSGEIISALFGEIHADALMLNIALIGGGAFLTYYGAALMLGIKKPVAAPIAAAALAPK